MLSNILNLECSTDCKCLVSRQKIAPLSTFYLIHIISLHVTNTNSVCNPNSTPCILKQHVLKYIKYTVIDLVSIPKDT